ncbi:MAG: FAD-binding oxidoreductase [Gloeotrichia echinulata GP01]
MLKLKIINSQTDELQKKTIKVDNEYIIGRHPDCDLVLNSLHVSRIHGRLIRSQRRYYFNDLGSTDGSRLNNEEVELNQNYILKPGDTIHIGPYFLICEEVELNYNDLQHQRQIQQVADTHGWTQAEMTVRCVEIIDETPDVKTFVFVAQPVILFTYQPGQFVSLELEINGERVLRSYSISSTPSRPHTLEITIKRVPQGLVSNWLHDNMKVGSEVKLTGPFGDFTCAAQASQKLLFICAGSGITPMMSMSRWLCDTAANVDIVFLHSARSPRDIIFRQELEMMAARHVNFQLAVTVTRREPGQTWLGYTGRLNASMLNSIAPDFSDRTVYVCGPDSFMQGVKTLFTGLEFPMQNYYEESFGSPLNPPTMADSLAPTKLIEASANQDDITSISAASSVVVFAKSQKEVICNGNESIQFVAKKVGVNINRACGIGVCGACKQKLLSGEIKYDREPKALTDEAHKAGLILTCIAHPVERVVIDV